MVEDKSALQAMFELAKVELTTNKSVFSTSLLMKYFGVKLTTTLSLSFVNIFSLRIRRCCLLWALR